MARNASDYAVRMTMAATNRKVSEQIEALLKQPDDKKLQERLNEFVVQLREEAKVLEDV